MLATSTQVKGQQNVYDGNTVLLKDEVMFGAHMHPRGWGLSFQRGLVKTVDRTMLLSVELLGMKHPKEQKQFNPYLEDAKSFVYGKLNSMYILRPSIGVKRVLTEKLRKNGVEISLNSSIGPSLAFTKPVYLEIWKPADGASSQITIDVQKYDPEIHSINNIYGRASSIKGLDELQFHPGVFFKTGFFFEYSPYQRGLRALEAGAMLDVYFDRVPIMALERNKEAFFNFYLNVYFGKKFNRRTKE
jgi:hypothetical protein